MVDFGALPEPAEDVPTTLPEAILRIEQLERALESRSTIGQAMGRLIERLEMNPEAAFAALSRISQDSNRRLRDIAEEIVEKGHAEGL